MLPKQCLIGFKEKIVEFPILLIRMLAMLIWMVNGLG